LGSIVRNQVHPAILKGFYRATLCVSVVFAVARCLSVCHVGGLYPDGCRYRQTSMSAR